ncbi:hypothetical protein BpHYR1_023156 [Brachionus plicatilis]|uniref:Reverse transcriptase domain-containing protein n=1 Tax=Brachionus plicatilis TaxID=10195 RepID=A0A3M7SY70_BRAPC|nr:hypothetical protein BpHYR1_023156 [Brachionus plicatilis]
MNWITIPFTQRLHFSKVLNLVIETSIIQNFLIRLQQSRKFSANGLISSKIPIESQYEVRKTRDQKFFKYNEKVFYHKIKDKSSIKSDNFTVNIPNCDALYRFFKLIRANIDPEIRLKPLKIQECDKIIALEHLNNKNFYLKMKIDPKLETINCLYISNFRLLIDILLQPHVKNFSNSQNLIQELEKITFNRDSALYSCDFESLYTNIDLDIALRIITDFMKDKLNVLPWGPSVGQLLLIDGIKPPRTYF